MPISADALNAHHLRFAAVLGLPVEQCGPILDDLAARYRSPDRHYHTLDHIRAVLDSIQALAGPSPSPALLLAAWFHDAVYDPRATDNEERSAEFMQGLLAKCGIAETVLAEAERLILLTKTHRCAADDHDGQVLLEADLAILGAEEAEYDAYAEAIRREYAWVAEKDYRVGRARVLDNFLKRERIYQTGALYRVAEDRARCNLRREIASLVGGDASAPP